MRNVILLSIVLLFSATILTAQNVINLEGQWKVKLDPDKKEILEQGFFNEYDKIVNLPGTTDEFELGKPLNTDSIEKVFQHLSRKHELIGKAWYQREIEITKSWKDKNIELKLELVKWKSDLWIDGQKIGSQHSLVTPHYFDVSKSLTPGKHTITIAVDNTEHFEVGLTHAYTEETQTIWNGIVGKMEMKAVDKAFIKQVKTYPNIQNNTVKVVFILKNTGQDTFDGKLKLSANMADKGYSVKGIKQDVTIAPGENTVEVVYPLGKEKFYWSEFAPNLFNLKVELVNRGKTVNEQYIQFGMREFETKDNKFSINGDKVFLRGTLDCSIFPKTGYPTTSVEDWMKIMKIVKEYGLNHIRYHSWCPPEAAFIAADKLGIYLQVELPVWNFNLGQVPLTNRFFKEEADRILNEFGNHPSFCMLTIGNELHGDFKFLNDMVTELKNKDSRHLYSTTAFSFQGKHGQWPEPADEYFISQRTLNGWVRGQGYFNVESPNSSKDYRKSIEGIEVPLVSHEIGQYSVYPDMKEIEKYDGVLEPYNLKFIREDLRKKGLLGQSDEFTRTSGKLAELLYKEEIERALRTPNMGGFQLLQLSDFSGQSTAHVGLLNSFWESKGVTSAEKFKQFCSPTTILLRTNKFVYENNDQFTGTIEVANYSPNEFLGKTISWMLSNKLGETEKNGSFEVESIANGEYKVVGTVNIDFTEIINAQNLELTAQIDGTTIKNQWDLWIYPSLTSEDELQAEGFVFSTDLEEVKSLLNEGKRVLFNPSAKVMKNGIVGKFVPVFWSPVHFPKQAGTMGILCDPKHPALADFPTDFHTNWQWWNLTRKMQILDISALPAEINPIIQVVDNFARNAKLGAIFEVKVGNGSLLISALDLSSNLAERPVARQLRRSLSTYIASEEFNPSATIELSDLDDLFLKNHPWHNAKVVSVSSEEKGYSASNILDGKKSTIWHTAWIGKKVAMPHQLVIDITEALTIKGIIVTPRQDKQKNGMIKGFELYISNSIESWGEPVAQGELSEDFKPQKILVQKGYLDESGVTGQYIRLKILSSYGDGVNSSIADIEVLE